jgi:hypothetical protein
VGLLIVLIVAASVGSAVSHNRPSTSGPCLGGPDMGSSGVSVGDGNYRFRALMAVPLLFTSRGDR